MPTKKLTKKQAEKQNRKLVEAAWYRLGHGVQVSIMDIGKIFARGEKALAEGKDLDTEILACVADYRKN